MLNIVYTQNSQPVNNTVSFSYANIYKVNKDWVSFKKLYFTAKFEFYQQY